MTYRPLSIRRWRHWASAAGLLLLAAAAWLWAHEGHAPLPTRGVSVDTKTGTILITRVSREALDTRAVVVRAGTVPDWLLAHVTLVSPWQRHAFASSRMQGRIVRLHARPGERVAAGATLAEIHSAEFENLQLELLNAQNDVRLSQQLLLELERGGVNVAEQTLADAENRQRQHQQALANARSKWFSLGLDDAALERLLSGATAGRMASLPVRSAIAGTIVHADLSVGKIVEPNEHLFEIVDLTTILARIDVLESELGHVATGMKVELRLTSYPQQSIPATVHIAGLYLDPVAHVNALWAELANPPDSEPRFLPGMTGQARIMLPARRGSILLPAAALVDNGVDRYVFVEEAETPEHSQFRRQSVEVLRQSPDEIEIAGGAIFPGDRVLERGSHVLAQSFVPELLAFTPEMSRSIGLRTAAVAPQVIEDVLELEGAVELPPARRTLAAAPMNGIVQAIHVELGQAVAAGTVIAEIASLEVQNVQLELLKEHQEVALFEQQLQRAKAAGSAVPRRKLLELASALNAARNRRENLRQRLLVAGFHHSSLDELLRTQRVQRALPIRAAIAGVVVHFDKVLGQAIRAEEPLFEIHDPVQPWLRVHVPEYAQPQLHSDQRVRVRFTSDPERAWPARVARSSRVFTPDGRVATAWLDLLEAPPYPLRHGQLARLSVTLQQAPAVLAVPLEALVRDGLLEFVFVANADGSFTRRTVTTARRDDRWIEIRHGLSAGERIAIGGAAALLTAHAAVR